MNWISCWSIWVLDWAIKLDGRLGLLKSIIGKFNFSIGNVAAVTGKSINAVWVFEFLFLANF